jgi:hypothetical protein
MYIVVQIPNYLNFYVGIVKYKIRQNLETRRISTNG